MLLHWLLYHAGLQKARTQLTPAETMAITRLASGRSCIVELGVFEGATSRRIREAMSPSGTLWCVDPFFPSRLGLSYGYSISAREVRRAGNGRVEFIRKFSHEAVSGWNRAIGLLFIDADHSYEAVRRDWEDWSPFVERGGLIALHDSRDCPDRPHTAGMGPARLAAEVRAGDTGFRLKEEVDTLSVFERTS